jgi:ribosomal protein L14
VIVNPKGEMKGACACVCRVAPGLLGVWVGGARGGPRPLGTRVFLWGSHVSLSAPCAPIPGSAITGPVAKECADMWPRIASAASSIV